MESFREPHLDADKNFRWSPGLSTAEEKGAEAT